MKYRFLELRSSLLDVELYKMLQEFPAVDEWGQTNEFFGKTKAQCKTLINKQMRSAYSLQKIGNELPVEYYVMYVDEKPVCIGNLRLKLDDYWKCHGGNIGYKTRPSQRRKGYATTFVKFLCQRAKELGMKEVLAQCKVENIASGKLLNKLEFEKNQGEMFEKRPSRNFYIKKL